MTENHQPHVSKNTIPKKIWFLWLQGLNDAPMIVKHCHKSWQINNPDWDLVFLDETNLDSFLDVEAILKENYKTISKQALSDVIRINLLNKYGGVWVDATCFCCKPLDSWLNKYSNTGFFAFDLFKPGKDRLISSWFMVSSKNNYLIKQYSNAVNAYWSNSLTIVNSYHDHGYIYKLLTFNLYTTRFWFSGIMVKLFHIYPYFWFHYLFTEIIRKDAQCNKIWDDTVKFSAEIPCRLLRVGLFSKTSNEIKKEIDTKMSPVYKLSWKHKNARIVPGCSLEYLLNTLSETRKMSN